jgi:hypothetical protein
MSRTFPALAAPRVWPRLAVHRPSPWPTRTSATAPASTGSAAAQPEASAHPADFVLAAGQAEWDADTLLARITPCGLSEQELLLALNQRDVAGLQEFTGFGPTVAERLVEFRGREKFFSSLDELVRVPLIGATRFRRLVGRDSVFLSHALHSTLRQPLTRTITLRDLQPLTWPAPGVPRVYLGDAEDILTERERARPQHHHLLMRRVGPHCLFIHLTSPEPSGWAAHLVAALPRALRRVFITHTPS